jgi:hypothetical protein
MAITHASRGGKTYYLHTGPKRGGGVQYFFSTDPAGPLASQIPEGFEVYETVRGQVYLRRRQPQLILDAERDCIALPLQNRRPGHRYKVEVRGKVLTVHESSNDFGWLASFAPRLSPRELDASAERFAHYQAVLRFTLTDAERRLFVPERYCFRGSVEDWISIGPPDRIDKLATKFLKHLGRDSMYELF